MKYDTLGARIKGCRKQMGLNQTELSKSVGRSLKMISLYENNLKMPPADILQKIAKKTEASVDYLLNGDEYTGIINQSVLIQEKPEVYRPDGHSVYIPVIYELYDGTKIDGIKDSHKDLILVERKKLQDRITEYFAICANVYYDSINKQHGGSSTFIIHRQDEVNSGNLAYIQYEGIPMIARVFIGKEFTSILTNSMSEKRLEIPSHRLDDLIIIGRVIFTIQEY